jgi:hypothetical protein
MVVGVPGAGINGLFYLLLSAVMPLEELPRTLSGRSSLARWKAIASLVSLAAAVLLTLWGEYWVLERAIVLLQQRFPGMAWSRGLTIAARGLAPALLVAPFLVLGAIILAVYSLGLALRIGSAVAAKRRAGAACVFLVLAFGLPLALGAVGCASPRVAAVSPPEGYNFRSAAPSILAELDSMESFDKRYFDAMAGTRPGEAYGLALANQTIGLIRNDPAYIEKARVLYAKSRDAASDPKEKRLADLGERYARSLLTGIHPAGAAPTDKPEPVRYVRGERPAAGFHSIVLGRSAIRVRRNATVKTQVDRVARDWLLGRNPAGCPWHFTVEDHVPWHEGEKCKDLVLLADAKVIPVWGTKATKIAGRWFAPDASGAPRFEISEDKVNNYPSTIVVDDHTAIVNDTHGISAIAWDALDADLVVGCGDAPGKMDAAYYLAERGVDVWVPTDRFLGLLMGARTRATIIGSAPARKSGDGAVIGNQPVAIDVDEPIVVSNSAGRYPLWYYDTPYRYFKALADFAGKPLRITPVEVKEYGRADVVVDEARRMGAKVIGIRVKSAREHDAVARWLGEDRSRRAVLFHTSVYPDGYRLFFEFPQQTSFGDIQPAFE